MEDCSGQEIVPIKKRLSIHTNRHTATDGTSWGWIKGCDKNICWADNKYFNHEKADKFIKEYNSLFAE